MAALTACTASLIRAGLTPNSAATTCCGTPLDQNRNRNSELFLRGQRSAVFLDIAHVALSQSALVSPVAVN